MFKNILVPTDGSEHSARAVSVANELASQSGARVALLHVVTDYDVPHAAARFAEVEGTTAAKSEQYVEPIVAGAPHVVVGRPIGTSGYTDKHAVMHDYAHRILSHAKSLATQRGVATVDTVTGEGDRVKQILESAKREGVDGIVMGSRGLSDLKGVILGSVSHKICHDADCICITVT